MTRNFIAKIDRFLDSNSIDQGHILTTAKFLLTSLIEEFPIERAGIWQFNSTDRNHINATCVVEANSTHLDTYSVISQPNYPNFFHWLKCHHFSAVISHFEFNKLGRFADEQLEAGIELVCFMPIKVKGQIIAFIQCEYKDHKKWLQAHELVFSQICGLFGRCLVNAETNKELDKLTFNPIDEIESSDQAILKGINQFALISTTDENGIITNINDKYLSLTGYQRQDILGQPQHIFNSGFHDKAYFQLMWRLLKQGNIWKGRLCNKKKNGEHYWLEATIFPKLDAAKKITGYIGFYQDISQTIETEQQLRHSERLAKLGSFKIDPGQTFWTCSEQMHRFLDVADNSLISQKDFERFIHPEHRTLFRFNFQSLYQDKHHITLNLRTHQTQQQWIQLTAKKHGHTIIGSIQDISEIQKKDRTLHKTIALQNAIFDAANFAVIATNTEGLISHFNRTAEELLGYKADEVMGIETPLIFHDPEEIKLQFGGKPLKFNELFNLSAKKIGDQEWNLISKNGRQIPVELSYSCIKNNYGQITGYLAVIKDISQQKQAEKTSSNLSQILATAGDLAHFGGFEYLIDEDNLQLTHVDLQALLASEECISLQRVIELVHPNDKQLFKESFDNARSLGMSFDIQIKIKAINSGYDWIRIAGSPQSNRSGSAILGFIHTINAQKKLEQQLSNLAMTDELTGVNNRRALLQTLASDWNRHQRYATPSSVLLIDIDYFKKVNDQWGHDVGDFLLAEFSRLMQQQLRNSDTFGRLGGEEFLIIASNNSEDEAVVLAEKLRKLIEQTTFSYQGLGLQQRLPIEITVSIGVAGLNDDLENQDQWLIEADNALYQAKMKGRNQVRQVQTSHSQFDVQNFA